MGLDVRRIVTGINEQGRSFVESDEGAPDARMGDPATGFFGVHMWNFDAPPKSPSDGVAHPEPNPDLEPPAGCVNWRIANMPPDTRAEGNEVPGLEDHPGFDKSRPGMHRTETIDFVTILEGEIDLDLDEGSVTLRAGDTVIQRGTWHAWRNRSGKNCVFSVVMVTPSAGP